LANQLRALILLIFLLGMLAGICFQRWWGRQRWCSRRAPLAVDWYGRPLVGRPRGPLPPPPPSVATVATVTVPTPEPVARPTAHLPAATATAPVTAMPTALPAAVPDARAEPAARTSRAADKAAVRAASGEAPHCPLRDAQMRLKSANRGGCFWGCSTYPACRGSRRPT